MPTRGKHNFRDTNHDCCVHCTFFTWVDKCRINSTLGRLPEYIFKTAVFIKVCDEFRPEGWDFDAEKFHYSQPSND